MELSFMALDKLDLHLSPVTAKFFCGPSNFESAFSYTGEFFSDVFMKLTDFETSLPFMSNCWKPWEVSCYPENSWLISSLW